MVQLVLGMAELPRPDDAADALAIAVWAAQHAGSGDGAAARRSWIARPSRRSRAARPSYERAVREALARERRRDPRLPSADAALGPRRDRLGRGRRRRDHAPIRSSSRSAASATGCSRRRRSSRRPRPGGRLKLHTYHLVREDQQALYGFRTAEELGFFNLLLTVTSVGPKVALAIVGSRPTADLQLAIMTSDQAVLVSIPGIGKKLAERIIFELKEKVAAAGVAALGPSGPGGRRRGGGRDRRRAPGARLLAGGGARGVADGARRRGVGGTLEERVKAALAEPPARLTITAVGIADGRAADRDPGARQERSDTVSRLGRPISMPWCTSNVVGGSDRAAITEVGPERGGRGARRRVLDDAADGERIACPEPASASRARRAAGSRRRVVHQVLHRVERRRPCAAAWRSRGRPRSRCIAAGERRSPAGGAGSSSSTLPAEQLRAHAVDELPGRVADARLDRVQRRDRACPLGGRGSTRNADVAVVGREPARSATGSAGRGSSPGRRRLAIVRVAAERDLGKRAEVAARGNGPAAAGPVGREERRLASSRPRRRCAASHRPRRQLVPDPDAGRIAAGRVGRERAVDGGQDVGAGHRRGGGIGRRPAGRRRGPARVDRARPAGRPARRALLVEDLEHRVADVDHHVAQRAGRLVRAGARLVVAQRHAATGASAPSSSRDDAARS